MPAVGCARAELGEALQGLFVLAGCFERYCQAKLHARVARAIAFAFAEERQSFAGLVFFEVEEAQAVGQGVVGVVSEDGLEGGAGFCAAACEPVELREKQACSEAAFSVNFDAGAEVPDGLVGGSAVKVEGEELALDATGCVGRVAAFEEGEGGGNVSLADEYGDESN